MSDDGGGEGAVGHRHALFSSKSAVFLGQRYAQPFGFSKEGAFVNAEFPGRGQAIAVIVLEGFSNRVRFHNAE